MALGGRIRIIAVVAVMTPRVFMRGGRQTECGVPQSSKKA